jgi:hypothetical protein
MESNDFPGTVRLKPYQGTPVLAGGARGVRSILVGPVVGIQSQETLHPYHQNLRSQII